MYNAIVVILCLLIPLIFIRRGIKEAISEKKTLKEYVVNNKYDIAIYFIFAIGFLVRLVSIQSFPAGFNQDEASAGYDAYSVLNYGIDRKAVHMPVYFIAWGSGQSVLLSFLMMPFIGLFGLSELTVRLPMAIVGCITLICVYKLFKQYNKKLAIVGLAFLAICPWHIMKCRWALDCNLFPDMVIIATCIIIGALKNNKMRDFYIGIAVLSLSVYSYATSFMVLPIYLVLMMLYLLITKKIKFRQALISAGIALAIAWPMILFVIINTFDYPEINLGFITIPRLYANRFESDTSLFSGAILENASKNFVNNMKIVLNQSDGTAYNCMPFYGITYIFSLPFTFVGLYNSVTKRNTGKNILNILSVTAVLLLIVYNNTNINRLNIVMVPIIMYTIIGLYYVIESNKNVYIPIILLYCISFGCFVNSYIKYQGEENTPFTKGVDEPIKYVDSLDVDKVYISYSFIEPYMYTLFYTQTPAEEFHNTVEYFHEKVAFESVKSFGKYYFYIPSNMNEENVAYIVPSNYNYNENDFNVKKFERYVVLERK